MRAPSLLPRLPMALAAMVLASWCALQSASASSTPGQQLQNLLHAGQVDKAERLLGFRPTPASEWLAETVRWHAPLLAED